MPRSSGRDLLETSNSLGGEEALPAVVTEGTGGRKVSMSSHKFKDMERGGGRRKRSFQGGRRIVAGSSLEGRGENGLPCGA